MPVAAGLRDAPVVRLLGTEAERRVNDAGRGRLTYIRGAGVSSVGATTRRGKAGGRQTPLLQSPAGLQRNTGRL